MGLLGTPLTERYNNPGALEYAPWMEKYGAKPGPNGRYAQFDNPQAGYSVMGKVLDTYQDKHGLNTVSGIVNRWAPSSVDNNSTGTYTQKVAKSLGVHPDEPLRPEHRQPLMQAMAGYEAGRPAPAPGASGPAAGSFRAAQEEQGRPDPQEPMRGGLLAPTPRFDPGYDEPPPEPGMIDRFTTALQSPLALMGMGVMSGKTVGEGLMNGAQLAQKATADQRSRQSAQSLASAMPPEYRAALRNMTAPEALNLFNHYSDREYKQRHLDFLTDHRGRQLDIAEQRVENWKLAKERQQEINESKLEAANRYNEGKLKSREEEIQLKREMGYGGPRGSGRAGSMNVAHIMPHVGWDADGNMTLPADLLDGAAEARVHNASFPGIGSQYRGDLPVDKVQSGGGSGSSPIPGVQLDAPRKGRPDWMHPGAKTLNREWAEEWLKQPGNDVKTLDPNNPAHQMVIQRVMDATMGTKLEKGKRWRTDGSQEDIPGAVKLTAGERKGEAMALMGRRALKYSRDKLVGPIEERDGDYVATGEGQYGWGERLIKGPIEIPGVGRVTDGFGEVGRAYKSANSAVTNLNFYMSGAGVSDAERKHFLDMYAPKMGDSQSTLAWKFGRLDDYFRIINSVRDGTQGGNDKIKEMVQSGIEEGRRYLPPQKDERPRDSFNRPSSKEGAAPVQVRTPQEADRLPSGTVFTTPDGRTMRKP